MDLFEYQARELADQHKPLAERMRPTSLETFFGQEHAVGEGSLVRHAVRDDNVFSMILWGPPGCGKTTLAGIIAKETRSHFVRFSAVLSGVKDIRAVIADAENRLGMYRKKTILFVDEIHRFNKAQQDAFLHHVESGLITLIGATTENPSFEVISPLLSRCRVITLQSLSNKDIGKIIDTALADREKGLGNLQVELTGDARSHLIRISDGDARAALNNLEIAAILAGTGRNAKPPFRITISVLEKALQQKALRYDKSGEEHFNLISAFHKSLRGSDPDAGLYWLFRMIGAGEDPLYIARRMVRFASEDIGNADPLALGVAMNAMEAYRFLGSPEGDLSLAHAAVYLATAPKSNAVYAASKRVQQEIKRSGTLPVPLHIRNPVTSLMKEIGYGKGYRYAHDFREGFVPQRYMPAELNDEVYYTPTNRGYEKEIASRLEKWRALLKKARENAGTD